MSDSSRLEVIEPKVDDGAVSEGFRSAILDLRRKFTNSGPNSEARNLNEILDKVYAWEVENQGKVSDVELESLQVLSLVLETMNLSVERKKTGDRTDREFAYRQSIQTQRDIVRLVFQNLDFEGKPNERIVRSLGLVCCVFENALDLQSSKVGETAVMAETAVMKEFGIWQGIMGMVTAAQMFHKLDWQVAFPPEELDLKSNVDYVVKNNKGEMFAVDVTAGIGFSGANIKEHDGELFYVKIGQATDSRLRSQFPEIRRSIRLNVPPLWHSQSESFYDPRCRKVGCPSKETMEKFKSMLNI